MEESEVTKTATRYLEMWNEQYALVNDPEIVKWAVTSAMHDIEWWIDGQDPNDSRETAGCTEFSHDELLELYRALAPSASFFCYTPVTEYLTET